MNSIRKGRIGFQGAKGANSEIASREVFPAMEPWRSYFYEPLYTVQGAARRVC